MTKESRDLIMQQQTIGKQKLLINMYYQDIDRVRKGHRFVLLDSIGLENVASCASMKTDELEAFLLDAKLVEPQFLLKDAAKQVTKCAPFSVLENSLEFAMGTYYRSANYMLTEMDLDPKAFEKEAESLAAKNYAFHMAEFPDLQVDEFFESAICFQRIAMEYLGLFTKRVNYQRWEKGYDWEVIEEMMRTKISKERFEEIEDLCIESMYRERIRDSEKATV